MKAVAGIDLGGAYLPALQLLRQLEFVGLELKLINVVEPLMPDGNFPALSGSHPLTQILDELMAAGHNLTERVARDWPGSTTAVELGFATSVLLESSKDSDLLVIGSQQKSLLETLFSGSMARAVATHVSGSALIGKSNPKSSEGLSVVIAHDLSDYSLACVNKFVLMAPQGVKRVTLLTAHTGHESILTFAKNKSFNINQSVDEIVTKEIKTQHDALSTSLSGLGVEVSTVVSDGEPNAVIRSTMLETDADLLVIGARGHGFVERLFVGSVALHQIVREPHNILLLRA